MGQDTTGRGEAWGIAVRVLTGGVWALLLCGVGLASVLYVGMMSEPGNAATQASISAMFAAVVLAGYVGARCVGEVGRVVNWWCDPA